MATQVQFRRGTTAETAAFTGALGEVTVDITKDVVVVHDGSTPGGYPSLRQDGVNSALQAGSLASPALKFANSATTGLYSPTTGTIALAAGGILALSTDTSGNLSTSNTFTATGRITTSSSFALATTSTAPTNGLYLSAANTVSIATNGSARLSVDGSGNLSVTGGLTLGGSFGALNFVPSGTSTAAATVNGLFLKSSSPATLALAAGSNEVLTINNSGNLSITGSFTVGGSFSATTFSPTGTTAPVVGMYAIAGSPLGLAFATNSTERLRIDSSGNVSISGTGTLNVPGAITGLQLSIPNSSSAPARGIYTDGSNLILATGSTARLSIADTNGDVTIAGTSAFTTGGNIQGARFTVTGTTVPTVGMYAIAGTPLGLAFATNSTQRLSIDSSGLVTIAGTVGTTALTTTGSISAGSFIPSGSTAPANGLYLSAANTLAFSTGGTGSKMTLDGSGNLVVSSGAVTVSSGNLTITAGNITCSALTSNVSSGSFTVTGSTAPTNGLYLSAANTVAIATASTQRITVNASGDVSLATGSLTVSAGNLTVTTGTSTAASFIPSGLTIPANGLYLPSANTLGFATASGQRLTIGSGGDVTIVTGSLTTSAGSNTARSFIPSSATLPTNGLYLPAGNSVGLATNSVERLRIDNTGIVILSSSSPALRFTGATSGYVELASPATASSNRLTLPNGNGSAGQVLSTDGTGILSWAAASGITQGTAQSLTGLTTYSFTGLPSTVKRILISIYNLSTNSNSEIMIRLIVGGTPVTSGYLGSANSSVFTAGFTDNITNSAAVRQGSLIISQHSSTVWAASGALARSDLGAQTPIAGTVSISGTVTGILITTLGGIATFDAGSEVNILYES